MIVFEVLKKWSIMAAKGVKSGERCMKNSNQCSSIKLELYLVTHLFRRLLSFKFRFVRSNEQFEK